MHRQALAYLNDTDDAEDVVQETLTKLWQMRDRIDDADKMVHLASVIVKNTSLNVIRNRKNSVEIHYADSLETNDAQDELEENETRRLLMKAISQLPDTQRAIIRMRNVEQLSYKEIAQVLGTTESSVRAMICKARTTLMNQMKRTI